MASSTKIEFNMDNACFWKECGDEQPPELDCMVVSVLVEGVADKIRRGLCNGFIMDFNGNKVGRFEVTTGI